MPIESMILIFLLILLVPVIFVILRGKEQQLMNGLVITSALLSLFTFLAFFFLRGSITFSLEKTLFEEKVLFTIALILAFNTLLELLKGLLIELVKRRHLNLPHVIIDLISWLAIFMLALMAVHQILAVDLTGVLVTSTVVSAIIALSLQNFLTNFFAGIILQMESPYSVDDWVEVGGQEARIVRQNWRTLTVLTRDKHYIVFPNSSVAQTQLINFSRPTSLQRLGISIHIASIHPPGEVEEVLRQAIRGVEGVLSSPSPTAYMIAYNHDFAQYDIKYWLNDYQRKVAIKSQISKRLWYALERAGMRTNFSQDVTLKMQSEDEEKQKQSAQLEQIMLVLRSLTFLKQLKDRELQRLAKGALLQRYTTGEALIQQGEAGNVLFIMKSGCVGVYLSKASPEGRGNERNLRIDERTEGEFFGEMSLLTGEVRSASIIAESETEVVTIAQEAFVEVLSSTPSILEQLLDALETRRSNIQTQRAADDARLKEELSKERLALLTKISNFLGIKLR